MCLCAFLGFAPPGGLDTDKLDKLDKLGQNDPNDHVAVRANVFEPLRARRRLNGL